MILDNIKSQALGKLCLKVLIYIFIGILASSQRNVIILCMYLDGEEYQVHIYKNILLLT